MASYDGYYYRAVITEVRELDATVRVQFTEYGNIEWVSMLSISECVPELATVRCRLYRFCMWHDIFDDVYFDHNEDFVNEMKHLLTCSHKVCIC